MSCLFRSLSYFIDGVNENSLRNKICNYLASNPKILDEISANEITKWESNVPLPAYVENMRKQSTWGGGIEIKCFCELTNLNVNVIFGNKGIKFQPSSNNAQGEINVTYTGSHYEPLSTRKYN